MTPNPPKAPLKGKGVKSERQKRLGAALRENLRKRKAQSQEREKSKLSHEVDPKV
jgi:hypothetical protein